MKAAIVLLADDAVQNRARRFVYTLNRRYQVPFYASRLPAHVSLKQPFAFEDLDALEAYFDRLAARTPPLALTLDRLYCTEWAGYAILGWNVVETPALRGLHERLNTELPAIVQDASAPHDGSGYHFHLTIEMAAGAAAAGIQEYYKSLAGQPEEWDSLTGKLGLFYYPDDAPDAGFIHYRSQPLAGAPGG